MKKGLRLVVNNTWKQIALYKAYMADKRHFILTFDEWKEKTNVKH